MKKAAKRLFGRSTKSPKNEESRNSSPSSIGAQPPPESTSASKTSLPLKIPEAARGLQSPPANVEQQIPPQPSPSASKLSAHEPTTSDSDKDQAAQKGTGKERLSQTLHYGTGQSRPSKSLLELEEAIEDFNSSCLQFTKKNQKYILVDDQLEIPLPDKTKSASIKDIANVFGENILKFKNVNERKKTQTENKWISQVGQFVSKLYPVAKLSLNLTAAIAEGASFAPLKGAAGGLGIILQILDDESGRAEDFVSQLREIEFYAALIVDNPNYDLDQEFTQNLLREKSTDLLTAIINFFNSALLYLSSGFSANLWKTVINGPEIYQKGKDQLNTAIRQYEQVVLHLTAHVVAKIGYRQDKQHNAEFLQWLAPSYSLVESHLVSFRNQRSAGTLEWALNMPEFQAWRLSDLGENSKHRITWMKGTLGIGKSIMAAYFIDLLKLQYPNAVIAYFFCRSNQAGLTNARDILRTLSYQCIENNATARVALERLKSEGLQITDDLCIDYLFEKLLLNPLRNMLEIYIVLDGLDEADMATQDSRETPELHVLLRCLARLPSTRLLCISRPNANIASVIPNVFSKAISREDNKEDIDAYVSKTVNESKTLQEQFRKAHEDPAEYFRKTGDGIFLWVVLVLQQLAKPQPISVFRKYLKDFSAARGSMEKLYSKILSRVNPDYHNWVKEVIRWLVVAKTDLSVRQLQIVVEWCLEDELVGFRQFLDENCGSILQFLPREGPDEDIVRLVHETFRSFIVDPKACPPDFLISETEIHGYIALKCLKGLTVSLEPKECINYATAHWVNHLSKATSAQQSEQLLEALHRFFSSEGLKTWILHLCADQEAEILSLRAITLWLHNCPMSMNLIDNDSEAPPREVGDSLGWRSAVLRETSLLGELIGKAATLIWLHERSDSPPTLYSCFFLSLKYYWRRKNRTRTNLEELNELTSTSFKGIYDWANPEGSLHPIISKNIGIGFYALQKWNECICSLQADTISDGEDKFWGVLAQCFQIQKDYVGLTETLARYPTAGRWILNTVYLAEREHDKIIEIIREALDRNPDSDANFYLLCWVFADKRDSEALIQLTRAPLINSHRILSIWDALLSTCRHSGDYAAAISACQEYVNRNPKDEWYEWSWSCLRDLYGGTDDHDGAIRLLEPRLLECPCAELCDIHSTVLVAKGDYDGAIRIMEQGLVEYPNYRRLYNLRYVGGSWRMTIKQPSSRFLDIAEAHIAKGDYDGAIAVVPRALEQGWTQFGILLKLDVLSILDESFQKKGDLTGLVNELQAIVEKYPGDTDCLACLGRAYVKKGDYDNAVTIFTQAIERAPRLSADLFTLYQRKGEYAKAIDLFRKVKVNANNSRYWTRALLDIHEATQDYQGIIRIFEDIVKAPENDGDWGWTGLLKVAAAKGGSNFDNVLERYESAIGEWSVEPSTDAGYAVLDIYAGRGDYDKAIQKITKIVNLVPLESWAWHVLAEAYKVKGDYENAIKVYKSALMLIPMDYSFYKCVADLYLASSDYHRVIECFGQARQLAGDLYFSAYLQFRPRDIQYEQILVTEAFHKNFFWHSVSEAFKEVGNGARAVELYNASIRAYKSAINEKNNDLLWIHTGVELGYWTFVGPFKRDALTPEVLWSALGFAYKAKGETMSALDALRKASSLQPENTYLQNVVRELEREVSGIAT